MALRILWIVLSLAGLIWSVFPWFGGTVMAGGIIAACFFAANLAAAVGWQAVCRWWRGWRGQAGRLARYFLAGFLMLCVAWTVFLSVWMAIAAANRPAQEGLPLIVLGSRVKGDRPGVLLEKRLESAVAYLQRNPGAVCIVSGGSEQDGAPTEAVVMKQWLTARGIAEERIYTEPKAANTAQNLLYAKEIMEQQGLGTQAVIATDGFHQLRGELMAKKAGLTCYAWPCATRWDLFLPYYVRELFALTRALLFGS